MLSYFRILKCEIIKQRKNTVRSRFTYFSLLIWPIISFFNAYYIYKPFSAQNKIVTFLNSQTSLVIFLIIGYLGYECFWTLVRSAFQMSRERQDGTLEMLFLSPANKLVCIYGRVLGSLIQNIWMFFCFSILTVFIAKGIPLANLIYLPVCFLVVILGAIAWGGLMNVIFLFSRDASIIFSLFNEPMHLLSGVRIPVTIFPLWAKILSAVLPLTHSLSIMRSLLINGNIKSSIPSLLFWLTSIIVMLFLTVVILRRAEKNARERGDLNFF